MLRWESTISQANLNVKFSNWSAAMLDTCRVCKGCTGTKRNFWTSPCVFVSFYCALLLLLLLPCMRFVWPSHAFHMRRQQFLTSISGAAFHLAYCEFYCFAVVYGTRSVQCKCLHSFHMHTHTHTHLHSASLPAHSVCLKMQSSAIFAWLFQSAPDAAASHDRREFSN